MINTTIRGERVANDGDIKARGGQRSEYQRSMTHDKPNGRDCVGGRVVRALSSVSVVCCAFTRVDFYSIFVLGGVY